MTVIDNSNVYASRMAKQYVDRIERDGEAQAIMWATAYIPAPLWDNFCACAERELKGRGLGVEKSDGKETE